MNLGSSFDISATGLRAERLRLDTIASNLANASTTRTPEGGPYRRRDVVLVSQALESDFAATIEELSDRGVRQGVAVADVIEDASPPRMVFDPGHPDANRDGFVAYPNVNPVTEMVDLMTATRAYEANVQAVNAAKRMADAALSIGG
ncbi:MAG TPA: flagellar basal body rod protein FlgC [Candidatus Binatia bacterium]|jgi:flagellar basal-body rod protein FlgC|nr:flagellar basal body rod protein FlgC [Candidatus Binatia bacterium]